MNILIYILLASILPVVACAIAIVHKHSMPTSFVHFCWKGDSVLRWIARFTMFMLLPVLLSAIYSWYFSGWNTAVSIRLSLALTISIGILFFVAFLWSKFNTNPKIKFSNHQKPNWF